MASPNFYNTCWMLSCFHEAKAYRRASQRVEPIQSKLLQELVSKNRDSWFGRHHRFASINSVNDFQRAVPLSTYEDYTNPVQRIARGESKVLTSQPVELLEPTSGSTSAEKLIPYTAGLRRSFQRAIRVWIWDLYSNRASLRKGKAYWSISPLANAGRITEAGIPVGFDHDAGYLGGFERRLLARTMAVPPEIALCSTVPLAQYVTLFFLLRCSQLSLISIWSPTFLQELLNSLQSNWGTLCDDVESGSVDLKLSQSLPNTLKGPFEPQPIRARQLREIISNSAGSSTWVKQLWPNLSMLSCWTDGPSRVYADNLSRSLSGIEIQPKGLLATEAFVSIPLLSHSAPALAVRSHFFEFLPTDPTGIAKGDGTLLAHELQVGSQYQVIVTTAGGLYRYQLMDQVEVIGFADQVPLLKFLGKCDSTSDLVGEKLNAAHVQTALNTAFEKHAISPTFYDLVAEKGDRPCYVLRVVDKVLANDKKKQEGLCSYIDNQLKGNPGYRYARDLGQLGCLRLSSLEQDEADDLNSERCSSLLQSGIAYGNIKPQVLSTTTLPG